MGLKWDEGWNAIELLTLEWLTLKTDYNFFGYWRDGVEGATNYYKHKVEFS
jgi:hypothetical protein